MTTETTAAPTTKASKASKASKAAPSASSNGDGLRPLQIKVLALLAKKGPMGRSKMYDALGFKAHSGLNDVLGKNDPRARKEADKAKYPSLLTLGYIDMFDVDGGANEYKITSTGKKALAKAN